MRLVPPFAAALLVSSIPVSAEDLVFAITNSSAKEVTALAALPNPAPEQASPVSVELGIAPGGSADVSLPNPNPVCVFDLTFTFADTSTRDNKKVDLCQVDTLVVE